MRIGLHADRSRMFQHHDSPEQIAAKLLVKRRPAFLPHIQRNIKQLHTIWLIQLLKTINKRPALHRHSPVVIHDARICFDHLRRHAELHIDYDRRAPSADAKRDTGPESPPKPVCH